jgi:hypothetical protein
VWCRRLQLQSCRFLPERLPAAHVEDDRGQLTLERLEDFEMPLTRLNDKAYAASLAGVAFDMTDGSRTVSCMVTYPALQDKLPGLAIARCVEAFAANRDDIEAIASAKFDAGRLENDGRIRVTTRDLNPHLFSSLHKTS